MKPTIEQANAARKTLVDKYGDLLEDCHLSLTDQGFVIEVRRKTGGRKKLIVPAEIDGVLVVGE